MSSTFSTTARGVVSSSPASSSPTISVSIPFQVVPGTSTTSTETTVVISNGSLIEVTTTSSSSVDNPTPSTYSQSTNNTQPSKGVRTGAIIGIVLGVLLFLACIIASILYARRRRRKAAVQEWTKPMFEPGIDPFARLPASQSSLISTSARSPPLSPTGATLAPSFSVLSLQDSRLDRANEDSTHYGTTGHFRRSAISNRSLTLEPARKQRVPQSPPTSPFNQFQPDRKEREAMEFNVVSDDPQSPSMSVPMHEDSGFWVSAQPRSTRSIPSSAFSEVPPMYTPR